MSIDRKPGLPVDLLSGVYRPEFDPKIENIVDGVFDPESIIAEAEDNVNQKIEEAQKTLREGPQKPLSELEAAEVDRKIAELQGEIKAAQDRIATFKSYIDSQAVGPGGEEVAFEISLKGRPELRRAVIQLFGKPVTRITYSMYLEAKRMKMDLEKADAEDYVAGNW